MESTSSRVPWSLVSSARGGVELRRHRAARVAFAHDRLQEHGLDVPALLLGLGEGVLELLHVVGLDDDQLLLVGS